MKLTYKLILIVSWWIFSIPSFLYANISYTPGEYITMTGSNDNIRFDVHGVLDESSVDATGAKLISDTMNLTGAFYMSWIWWGLLQTWSYQVWLDCGASVDFSALPNICHLTGSGWSEMIGELWFSGAEYHSASGTLSGTIRSNFWDIPLEGIYLPLLPASFTIDLNNSIAKHDHTLTISWSTKYAPGAWMLKIDPQKPHSRTFSTDENGIFSPIDISLADKYTITITDPDEWTTVITGIDILPWPLSLSLIGGTHFIQDFCNTYEADCPDGKTLSATTHTRTWDDLTWDGESYYHFRLKSRDQYGNAVDTWSMEITYTTTVKTNQLDDLVTVYPTDFSFSIAGDAAIVNSWVLANNFDGTSSYSTVLNWLDILYSIASIAPTDLTDNVIQLQGIDYTTSTGVIIPITWLDTTALTFNPWYTATLSSPTDIHIGEKHEFRVDVTRDWSRTDTPAQIFSFLTIGDWSFAAFRDFTSLEWVDCEWFYQEQPTTWECVWPQVKDFTLPSVLKVTASASSYMFTGSYAPMTRYPLKEFVRWRNIISYKCKDDSLNDVQVLYHNTTVSDFWESLFQESNVKILWTSNGWKEYGDMLFAWNGKAKYFDALKQKITLLSRNRTSYSDVDYMVVNWDFTLTGWSFATKRTIIILGWTGTISQNIARNLDHSLALIALSDSVGKWWAIVIDPTVTDVNLSLITDRHITSSGDNQLYINGNIISSNTLGDTLAQICPYYITVCDATESSKYDFENIRSGFRGLSDTTGKTSTNPRAWEYPHTPMIIEYDMRIVTNPPPGL
jgi:hypothetical protein